MEVSELINSYYSGRRNFVGINLSKVDMNGIDLSNADLSGANLSASSFYGANLSNAKLNGADFNGSKPENMIGSGAYVIEEMSPQNLKLKRKAKYWGDEMKSTK